MQRTKDKNYISAFSSTMKASMNSMNGGFIEGRRTTDGRNFRIKKKVKKQKITTGKSIPRSIRKNPFSTLPILTEKDLSEGVYRLMNQGYIPKDVDVNLVLNRNSPLLETHPMDAESVVLQDTIHKTQVMMDSMVSEMEREELEKENGLVNNSNDIKDESNLLKFDNERIKKI